MQPGNYAVDADRKINWKVFQIIWPYMLEYKARIGIALVCLVVSFAMLTLAWCKIKQLMFLRHSHKEIT